MSDKNIEPDKALLKIEDDALGVSDLAKRIAKSIVRMSPHEGLVIGLYGKWGSGKTTFVNFVKQALSAFKQEEQPIILHFNPWLFAGREDLIQRYLVELSKILSPAELKNKERRLAFLNKVEEISSVSEQLLTFAASLSGVPLVADSVKAINTLSQGAIKKLSEQEPLSHQKEKIEKLLRERKQKILVVIDDIDRLESREVLDIFRMVKSVADFPNVIYLLSFDKEMVSNVIAEFQNSEGADYLEKIVQYDVDIPYPEHAGMLKLFGERIDPTIETPGGQKWNTDRWSTLYMNYLRQNLRTPRQAIRLSNSFNIAYPALRGEVDPVDFLAIEALRMFHTEIYYEIRRNPDKYTEYGQASIDKDKEKTREKSYFEKIIKLAAEEDQESVKEVLELLFPRVEAVFSSFISDSDLAELRANARIASTKHFGRYFSYTIMPNQFSDAEIREAIELTTDIEKFENLIVGYSKQIIRQEVSRIPEFLERFLDIVKAGQAENYLSHIITNFLILGDLIVREEDEDNGGWTRISTDLRILWMINESMKRLPDTQSIFEILKPAFSKSKSIHTLVRLLSYFGREHGMYGRKKDSLRPGKSPYLSTQQLKELETIVLSKIEQAANNDTLLDNIEMLDILFRWRDFTDSFDKPKAWVQKITSTDEGLKKLLSRFSNITIKSSARKTERILNVRASYVENFLDLEATHARVQTLLKGNTLNEKERVVLEAFVKSYQEKKDGKSDLYE